MGGSQGGQLSIVTAALDRRVTPKQLLIAPQQGQTTIRKQMDPIEARLGVRK